MGDYDRYPTHPKKYLYNKVLFKVTCIDNSNSLFLWIGHTYDVIKVTETNYLIRFASGGTTWYSRSRFLVNPLTPNEP